MCRIPPKPVRQEPAEPVRRPSLHTLRGTTDIFAGTASDATANRHINLRGLTTRTNLRGNVYSIEGDTPEAPKKIGKVTTQAGQADQTVR